MSDNTKKQENPQRAKPLTIIIGLILFFLLVIAFLYIAFYYSYLIINSEGLKALIEAETTLLGFFGLIIAYVLTSLDTKQEKLEDFRKELIKANPNSNQFNNNLNPYRDLKRKVIRNSSVIGIMLTASLFMTIGLLGYLTANSVVMQDPLSFESRFSGIVGTLTVSFIGLSIFLLFKLYHDIGNWE